MLRPVSGPDPLGDVGNRAPVADATDLRFTGATFAGPQEVLDRIAEAVAASTPITGVTLFCGPDASRKALCFLDVKPEAAADVAQRLGGQTYGFSSVTAGILLTGRFDCRMRRDGSAVNHRCSCRLA